MKRKTLQQWVKALRSGDFTQTQGLLRAKEPHQDYGVDGEPITRPAGHCCLGVLAEVCPRKNAPVDMHDGMLPDEYLKEIGLSNTTAGRLAVMNDKGTTFEQIADFLEDRFKKLVKKANEKAKTKKR